MTKLVSSTSVSLLATMSSTIALSSFWSRCSPSSFFLMYAMLSGLSAISSSTVSLFFALSASSTSSKSPMCPGLTAFLVSAMSRTAIVFLPSFFTMILSRWCRSSSCASCRCRITIWTSPVAISMSLTLSFMSYAPAKSKARKIGNFSLSFTVSFIFCWLGNGFFFLVCRFCFLLNAVFFRVHI